MGTFSMLRHQSLGGVIYTIFDPIVCVLSLICCIILNVCFLCFKICFKNEFIFNVLFLNIFHIYIIIF